MLGDRNEEEPIAVERRFGIAQYQPDASAHARGHRWRVVGLDMASPWNPKSPEPGWVYTICKSCKLRYGMQEHVRCPRCGSDDTLVDGLPGHEFGGFLAKRDDTPVLEDEDRFAMASLVQCHPQWNGRVLERFELPTGWRAELRAGEEIRWLNEWKPPSELDRKDERPLLHDNARGFYLCPSCGQVLEVPVVPGKAANAGKKGRRKAAKAGDRDPFGHAPSCVLRGKPPRPRAITTRSKATTLRIVVHLPPCWRRSRTAHI